MDQVAYIVTAASLNTASDIYVFLLPLWYTWKLQMPRAQVIGVSIIFSLGLVVCVVGIIRVWYSTIYFGSYDAACAYPRSCHLLS